MHFSEYQGQNLNYFNAFIIAATFVVTKEMLFQCWQKNVLEVFDLRRHICIRPPSKFDLNGLGREIRWPYSKL